MSDEENEPSGKKKKVKTKRVLRRTNTAPMKASKKNQVPSVTLPQMENNFASQFHTLADDEEDPTRTAQQQQMERKLAKLRSKSKLNQRRSAPSTPRGGRHRAKQQQPAANAAPKRSSATTTALFGRSHTDINDAFEDPFFTDDPFADFPNDNFSFSSPDVMGNASGSGAAVGQTAPFSAPNVATTQPPPIAQAVDPLPVALATNATQSYTQALAKPSTAPSIPPFRKTNSNPASIANEKERSAPSTVPLAPPATNEPPKRATTRSKRSNTLPTLSMSNTSGTNAPVAVTTDEREIRLDFDPFDTVERPPLKNDDSSDLTMFYSYSAPASRRTSRTAAEQRAFVPYVHPAGVDTSGRSSLVYVPVQVPAYNVAGGVPYVNGQQAMTAPAGAAGQYAYGQTGGQWVQQPYGQQVPVQQYPVQQYPMTPPPGQAHQQWGS